ncbi:hypothetical protein Dimus_037378, partial [Dionaea muscipula]
SRGDEKLKSASHEHKVLAFYKRKAVPMTSWLTIEYNDKAGLPRAAIITKELKCSYII